MKPFTDRYKPTILHTAIRIDDLNPVHVRLSVFQGAAYDTDVPLIDQTRALSGQLVISRQIAAEFIVNFPSVVNIFFAGGWHEGEPIPEQQRLRNEISQLQEQVNHAT